MDRYQALAGGHVETDEDEDGDPYQKMADGREPVQSTKPGPKIDWFPAVVLIVISIILDLISILDVFALDIPIADIISTIFSFALLAYLLYKGIAPMRPMVRWIAMYLAEWIPLVDWLPLYLIGMILVIAADRNAIVAAATKYIPSKAAVGKKAAGAASQRIGKQFAKNKVFGKAGEAIEKKAVRLVNKLQGPLRSTPQSGPRSLTTMQRGVKMAGYATKTVSQAHQASDQVGKAVDETPFPGTYEQFESELGFRLKDVVNVNVSGDPTPEPPPRGPNA